MSQLKKITKYEDLLVSKKSMKLAREILLAIMDLNIYSFKDRLCRSVISIPSNIAERYERQSNKEYIRFLYIVKVS